MKKALVGVLLFIIIAIAAVVYYVFTNIDHLVKTAIEKYGSQATQTAVRVDKVNIHLTKGTGSVSGLAVANPPGFAQPNIFSLGEINVGIDIKSLNQQPYVINDITIRQPQVFVDMNNDKKINLNELKKNIQPGAPKEKAPSQTGKEPRLIIHHILFTNGTINATIAPLNNKEYTLKLPTLNMDNLGGTNGATPTELSREILSRLIDHAQQEFKSKGVTAIEEFKSKAQEKIESEKSKLKGQGKQKLEQEKEKLKNKLKGLTQPN